MPRAPCSIQENNPNAACMQACTYVLVHNYFLVRISTKQRRTHRTAQHCSKRVLYPNRIEKRNRKSSSYFDFDKKLAEVSVRQNRTVKNRNPGEKQRRARPTWAVHNCCTHAGKSSARQHRSTTDAGQRDGNSIPGGCWASHGGGGAPNGDAPKIKLEIILRTNFRPRSRGHYPQISLKLCSLWLERRETKARERRGWCCGSACWLLARGLCGCAAVLAVGWMLYTAVLI